MNYSLSALVLVSTLLAPQPEVLRFAPEPGARVRKEFTGSAHLVQTIETVNGDPKTEAPFQVTGDLALDLLFEDSYRALALGRPQTLGRTLKRAALGITTELLVDIEDGMKPLRFEKKLRSDRAETPLVFRWQEAESRFSAQLETTDDTPGLHLERLREETDLRSFLPMEEVEAGSTWNIPVQALSDLFSPGGDLAFRFESGGHATHDDFKVFGLELGAILLDMESARVTTPSGAVRGTFKGHDKNKKNLARIEVEFDLHEAGAATKALQRLARSLADRRRSLDAESKHFSLRGKGTILWNTKKGLPESAEFEANLDTEWLVTSRTKEARGGGDRVVTDRRTMTGTITRTYRTASTR